MKINKNNCIGGDTIKKILIFLLLGVNLFISSCNLYSNHNHIACSECGRCTDAECDGEELDKCIGHTPKHEHVGCPECGKCTDAECDGEVLDKCFGHAPKHEHVACPDCGKCTDAECDGEVLDKCLGHAPKHEHIACQDCGKCISELCDGLKEERCQGCIKICLTNKIYVSHLDLDIDSPKYYIIDTYEEFIKFVNENSLMEIQFGEHHGSINVDYYNDLYFPAYDDYDEAFFLQNSLILFSIKDFQRRQNPQLVYDLKYENKVINVHASLSVDKYTMNFKGIIFQFAEVSKFLINDYQEIEYIFDKFIILD